MTEMITSPEIWNILDGKMPYNEWMSLKDIYGLVKEHGNLDIEDNAIPALWQKKVRSVLQHRKKIGQIVWDNNANYKLV